MSVEDGLKHSVTPAVWRSPHDKRGMMGARKNDMIITHLYVRDDACKMEGKGLQVHVQAE